MSKRKRREREERERDTFHAAAIHLTPTGEKIIGVFINKRGACTGPREETELIAIIPGGTRIASVLVLGRHCAGVAVGRSGWAERRVFE